MLRWLALLSLVLLVACGSRAARIESPDAAGWESELLGRAPDARMILRIDAANRDPVYGGPASHRDDADPEIEALVRELTSIEVAFAADGKDAERSSFVVIARGKPSLDLLRKHRAPSKPPERLPTGVLAYDLTEDTPVALFVLPSGTWVLAAGRITNRARYHFFSHGEDPREASFEPDALLALWIGKGVTRLSDLGKSARGFEELSFALRSSERGDLVLRARFSDEASAEEAHRTATLLLARLPEAQKALADECPAWQSVRLSLDRSGRTLLFQLANLPPLVRAYRTGACRERRRR